MEIKAIIKSLNVTGDCKTCNGKNVYIYDTTIHGQLVDVFNELLEVYLPTNHLPDDYPREKMNLLKDELYEKWGIFNIDKEKIYTLITNICYEKYNEYPEIFDSPISIMKLNDNEYLQGNSITKTHSWEHFVKEIQTNNRFHTDYINTNVLDMFCGNVKKTYKGGTILYRARISTEDGFTISEMGAPPSNKASDGRANPLGISCLYLASDRETTLHEIKAGAYDYVTIGEFELQEDIDVIDFIALDKIGPFSGIDMTLHAINKENTQKIGNEIAKPLRRNDGPLDYLPTQYITDFIKSKGYKGIKYKSTMNKDGYNLAIFNPGLFQCRDICVYDVRGIKYDSVPLYD
ncbi:hypothetical protein JOC34_002309 [Virgibacillus halotolerans]|uniref:RES domain-containing protein n=1 Tax=Virgibacillus halotolerans TaxID=1071053 RepID=UPI001961E941|nr:hypothetical protein [Virgibacillus halotolerans]